MERLRAVAQQVRDFLLSLPPARRLTFVALSGATLVATFALVFWVQTPRYQAVLSGLDASDAAAAADLLKAEKIPYRFAQAGSAVEVPAERVDESRILLAGRGVPQGGGVGFEIFDRQTLGMTDFVQRLGYQRALQGELARTIGSLTAVESARVHLALPERSLFVGDDRRPSASVVVKVRPGRRLSPDQVTGIVNLVAASVEGLRGADVTVVDTAGEVLSSRDQYAEERGPAEAMRAYQREIEHAYVQRIETMLERALGSGQAVARVTATLDLAEVERTEEIFDPDRVAVKSERRTAENNRTAGAGGAPGVGGTLTNDPATAGGADGNQSEQQDAVLSYEISRTTSRRVEPRGALRKLSVAVLIDGVAQGEGESAAMAPRPAEEVERYKELVKRVVGFNAERGDEIEVVSAPFNAGRIEAEVEPGLLERVTGWSEGLWRAAGLALALVVALAVVRPFLLAMVSRAPVGAPGVGVGVGVGVAPVEATLLPGRTEAARPLLDVARQNPEQTALIIKRWVSGGAP